jgi:flagellin
VAVENLSASESRIRDVDMAAEMAELTKRQVLTQAGTAMVAQANSSIQSVVNLLR